jgi:hypothetical protein
METLFGWCEDGVELIEQKVRYILDNEFALESRESDEIIQKFQSIVRF